MKNLKRSLCNVWSSARGKRVAWSPKRIQGVAFPARGGRGETSEYRLEVDDIRFYADQ